MNTTIKPDIAMKMFPIPPEDEHLECPYCLKHPNEFPEYVDAAKELNLSAVDYVKSEEGTYCQYTGYFICTNCYVDIGLPTNKELHTIFPVFRMEIRPLPGQNNFMVVKFMLGEI